MNFFSSSTVNGKSAACPSAAIGAEGMAIEISTQDAAKAMQTRMSGFYTKERTGLP